MKKEYSWEQFVEKYEEKTDKPFNDEAAEKLIGLMEGDLEQRLETEKPEGEEEVFELGDAGYSQLPEDVAEQAKDIIKNKAQILIHTRLGREDHRQYMWDKGNRKVHFGRLPKDIHYLSYPIHFSDKGYGGEEYANYHSPYNTEDLAKKIVSMLRNGKNPLIFGKTNAKGILGSRDKKKIQPFFITYDSWASDFTGSRKTVPAVTFALEKEDFRFLSDYLKKNPKHATAIFYGVPIALFKEEQPNYVNKDDVEKGIDRFENVGGTPFGTIASMYYYCKEKHLGDSEEYLGNPLEENSVEIIDIRGKQ